MTGIEIFVALAILVGAIGVIVPVLPGTLLVGAAVLVWAIATGGTIAWVVFAVVAVLLVVGMAIKYAVPGARLKAAGVPTSTLAAGGAAAILGFFLIPFVGMPVGFVAGIYLVERQRLGPDQAWPSTRSALGAVGLSMGIELATSALAASVWVVGVITT